MSRDYNALFGELECYCEFNNFCDLFRYAEFEDIKELNRLLDKFLIFFENFEEDIDDYDCGDELNRLYRLVRELFDRDC